MRKTLVVIFFLVCVTSLWATQTTIEGESFSKEYFGTKISLQTFTNRIIDSYDILDEAVIDSSGKFKFSVNISSITEAYIPLETCRGFIYLVPGKTYHVKLPQYTERSLANKLDPYYAPTDFLLESSDFVKGEFNYQMMEFEDAFDYYTLKHITYGTQPDSIRKSISDLKRIFTDLDDDYQFLFKEYRYLLLQSMSDKIPQDSLLACFNKMGTEVSNPAFWDAFTTFFEDIVSRERDGGLDNIIMDKIIREQNVKMFFALIANKYGITDSNLKELAAIKIIYDVANSDAYDRFKIIEMMKKMGGGILSDANRRILAEAITKLSINLIGSPAPDFIGEDTNGKTHHLSDFKGKFIYINFCNSHLNVTKRDLDVLLRFANTYKNDLTVINLFLFDSTADIARITQPYKDKMVFLNAGQPDLVKLAFNLKNVPSFIILDRDLNFLMTKGTEPNDEFRVLMEKLLK